ncbi:hypothetical protein [Bacillus sp. 1P02SD]|uniref:hypothetical protein n=1 Tax=Bacillus sp. 1P02SD TaxID=3132264 RepID=UPI00399FEAB9
MVLISFRFDFDVSLISMMTFLIGWGTIVFFSYRIYKKQEEKPKLWKIILVLLVGLFTFSFNMNLFETLMKIPILPLGVWILYFILRSKEGRWERYRQYAWLGFLANFLFVIMTLASVGLQYVIYPPGNIATYVSEVESAKIINTHPAAKDVILQKDIVMKQLSTMQQTEFFSDQWYEETYMYGEPNTRKERFPYQVIGVQGKWGSNVPTTIFIEEDGKGLLIATPKKQYYFRSDVVFLKGV